MGIIVSKILEAFVYFLMYAGIILIFPFFFILDKYPIVSMITLAVFPMCAQLFCIHVFKNRFVKLLPTLLFAVSGICLLIEYLLMDYFRGLDVIGMMVQGMLLIPVAVGLALAWIIILIQKRFSPKRKTNEGTDALPEDSSEIELNESDVCEEESPILIRDMLPTALKNKIDSAIASKKVTPEKPWEKDTQGLPDLFLFFFSAYYCLAFPVLVYSKEGVDIDNITAEIFMWFTIQFVMQLIFSYTFKSKVTKSFPAIHIVLLFVVFLICKAQLGGNLPWERDLFSGMSYACICGALGNALAWIIYCIPWNKILKFKLVRISESDNG